MNPFQTKEFKKLQSQWYTKLKKQGFQEIEDTQSQKEFLKDWHSSYFQERHSPLTFWATEEYYSRARFLLNVYSFPQKQDKIIWHLHSEGLSLRKIAAKLNLKIWIVHQTIKFLETQIRWYLILLR